MAKLFRRMTNATVKPAKRKGSLRYIVRADPDEGRSKYQPHAGKRETDGRDKS